RRRHTRFSRDWSSDVCSSDLAVVTTGTAFKQNPLTKLLVQVGSLGRLIHKSPGGGGQTQFVNQGFLGFTISQTAKDSAVDKAGVLRQGVGGQGFGPLFPFGCDDIPWLQGRCFC